MSNMTQDRNETTQVTLKHLTNAAHKLDRFNSGWYNADLEALQNQVYILLNRLRNIEFDKRVYTNDGDPHYYFETLHTEKCTALHHVATSMCPFYRKQIREKE